MKHKRIIFITGVFLLAVLMLGAVCGLGGCGGGGNGDGENTSLQPVAQTIAGTDADNDGVWDYIQQYIESTYPNSAKMRAVLKQDAKSLQAALLDADDREASFQHAQERNRAAECLWFIQDDAPHHIAAGLLATTLNTEERSKAYIKFNDQLGGSMIADKPLSEWKSSCNFNPDALEN